MKHFVFVLFAAVVLATVGPGRADASREMPPARVDAAREQPLLRLETNVDAMGSTFTLILFGPNEANLRAASDEAAEEAHRIDRMISNYQPGSEWSRINREGAERPVEVSPEDFNLLQACMDYSRASGGAFDITVGPLMKVWGFYKGSGRFPHRAEVRSALDRVGYRHLVLDPARRTVRFDRTGMEIDPGGIGKGYAVDRMTEAVRRNGVRIALIGGSASSIYAMGAPPSDPRGWKIGIKDPKERNRTIQDVYLKDESMSTSGNYEKFFYAEGRMWSHIMDPRTGYPSQGVLQVSVIAPRTVDSEAWTKPYYVNGRRWTAAHKPNNYRVFFCEDKKEAPCAWLP